MNERKTEGRKERKKGTKVIKSRWEKAEDVGVGWGQARVCTDPM